MQEVCITLALVNPTSYIRVSDSIYFWKEEVGLHIQATMHKLANFAHGPCKHFFLCSNDIALELTYCEKRPCEIKLGCHCQRRAIWLSRTHIPSRLSQCLVSCTPSKFPCCCYNNVKPITLLICMFICCYYYCYCNNIKPITSLPIYLLLLLLLRQCQINHPFKVMKELIQFLRESMHWY